MSSVAHMAILQQKRRVRDLPQLRRLLTNARTMRAAVATTFYADFVRAHGHALALGYDVARARGVASLCTVKALRRAHPLAEVQGWLALLVHAALRDAVLGMAPGEAKSILNRHLRELQQVAGRVPGPRRP